MSTAVPSMTTTTAAAPAHADSVRRDTLSASVVFLIGLSCVQPVVAFARGVVFCRWLDPIQLGCWDMALGFMSLAAPLVVLGIPGSFGRYVEHYAQRGQLSMFLRRTALLCGVLMLAAGAIVACGGRLFSELIFNSPAYADLVALVAVGLATMTLFGFVVELLTAWRMFRVVSGLQLLKGVGFALFGGLLLLYWDRGAGCLIAGHALASLLAAAVGLIWLWPAWRSLPPAAARADRDYVPHSQLWARLLPFALWVWVTNILSNAFEIVDRAMIIHCSNLAPDQALTIVGQYHSSRIVPLLFVSFAGMLGSLVLPHLSRDWEAGHRQQVDARVNFTLKSLGLSLTAGSAAILWIAPWLFRSRFGFQGRYDGGLTVLPWTLTYCAWFGMSFIGGTYLWCAERVRLGSAALLAGLAVNIVLNVVLLPQLGLLGAVLATAASKLVVLGSVLWFSRMLGMRIDRGTLLVVLLPLVLSLGAAASTAALVAIGLAIVATNQVFVAEEKRQLFGVLRHYASKLGSLAGGLVQFGG